MVVKVVDRDAYLDGNARISATHGEHMASSATASSSGSGALGKNLKQPSKTGPAYEAPHGGGGRGNEDATQGQGLVARAGNTDELLIAWAFSAFQRFVLHEPSLILAAKGLPIL